MKRLLTFFILVLTAIRLPAQVVVTGLGIPYTQIFNSLRDAGLNNPYTGLAAGWFAQEVGSGANTLYRAAWGQLSG